jgi:hypothetical protein
VAPGNVATDGLDGMGEEHLAQMTGTIPLGRLAQPQEIADAVEFLAGERASFITGQVITSWMKSWSGSIHRTVCRGRCAGRTRSGRAGCTGSPWSCVMTGRVGSSSIGVPSRCPDSRGITRSESVEPWESESHWTGVCDAVVPQAVAPNSDEVAWHDWLSESELPRILREWTITPDTPEILGRDFAGRTVRP